MQDHTATYLNYQIPSKTRHGKVLSGIFMRLRSEAALTRSAPAIDPGVGEGRGA